MGILFVKFVILTALIVSNTLATVDYEMEKEAKKVLKKTEHTEN